MEGKTVPFMCFNIKGAPDEVLVYTTPKVLETDEAYLKCTMSMLEETKKFFPSCKLLLFYYLYLPPPNDPSQKANFCYHSMVTEEGMKEEMAEVLKHHQMYCENTMLVQNLLRDSTMQTKPVGFIMKKGEKLEFSKDPPNTVKQGQYGHN